ncbi:MAG: hypothetical protein ACI82Z_000379 [Cellvibrionaceae bacterium]|jgi:hypothetical protein
MPSWTVDEFLADGEAMVHLLRYCRTEYNDENISFLNSVQVWRRKPDGERTIKDRNDLINKYIMTDAPKEVNLPSALRTPIEVALVDATVPPDSGIFDAAVAEIKKLLTKDVIPRFLKTDDGIPYSTHT